MIFWFTGQPGSGKTTLLNLIAGIDTANSGEILVLGKDLSKMTDLELTEYRRDSVGYIFQFYNLLPNLTVIENASLGLELKGEKLDYAEVILEKVKSHAASAVQSQIADQLFHQAYSSEVEIEQLATSRVLEQDGDFVNVDTGEKLPRVEDSLLGLEKHMLKGENNIFGERTEEFFNNLAVGASFEEIS